MANQLTYDPTEADAPEFSEEELDSLRVGEELAAQEESLLAGKYRDAEELEKAYIELQKKFGSRDTEDEPEEAAQEEEPEQTDEEEEGFDPSILDTILEQARAGEFTDDVLDVVENLTAAQVIDMLVERGLPDPQSEPLPEETANEFKAMVGGEETYNSMLSWAAESLDPQEIAVFNQVIEQGNAQSIYFAIQALYYRYNEAVGYDGELLTGKASSNSVDVFRSQAEVVRAMKDPRYESDPAYRQDVYDKLERSNIPF